MNEQLSLFVFLQSLRKKENRSADDIDRFYQEHDGADVRAIMSFLAAPFHLIMRLKRRRAEKRKNPETLPISGSARQQCC